MDKKINIKPEDLIKEVSKMVKTIADSQKKTNERLDALEIKPQSLLQIPSQADFILTGQIDYCEMANKETNDAIMQELIKFMQKRHITGIRLTLHKKF